MPNETTKTIAAHTLGCRVNQYDTQAMLECFQQAGYSVVPFPGEASVYLINTCTVTGTGDKKSLQLARRLHREHPDSEVILCGCLAQHAGEKLFETGARLVIGTSRRLEIVQLLEEAIRENKQLCAVNRLDETTPFEPLNVSAHSEHTRAVLKIQEGCNNHCTYCIIPSVRGPIRSRPVADCITEARRLTDAGYRELVLTGIHMSSYGRDLTDGTRFIDLLEQLDQVPRLQRMRLGSLEPTVITEDTVRRMGRLRTLCPQFHLALQSGSDTVLARMARRYNTAQYEAAADLLRTVFPDAALTTDVLTGFPGESDEEYQETRSFIRRIGFARIHVFPYSPRPDTKAAVMPGQLTRAVKEQRARELIALGNEVGAVWRKRWIGRTAEVLLEDIADDHITGYTPEYVEVRLPCCDGLNPGLTVPVMLNEDASSDGAMCGTIVIMND